MAKHNIKELSIQVSLNGLSFCILNRTLNHIEYINCLNFESRLSPLDVLNRLRTELSNNVVFTDDFHDIHVIHQNELATLVPKEYYSEDYKTDYLKFNSKILRTDFITTDEITINDSINVYVPYVNINNYIFGTFGEFEYKHASSVFIDAVLQRNSTKEGSNVYINVNSNAIEFLVIDKNQIQLYNYFEFQTKEDFIYYILFVFEQLSLDAESTPVYLSGSIRKDDDYFKMVYKYIRHVEILTNSLAYTLPDGMDENKYCSYFLILNSF